MRAARVKRMPRKQHIARLMAMAETLANLVCNLGSPKLQRDFGRWLAAAAFRAGQHAALACLTGLMELAGIDAAQGCGCRRGAAFGLQRCDGHGREARERAKREQLHRTCPCGLLDELTKMAADCHRRGDEEGAERNAKARAAHVCPGERPAKIFDYQKVARTGTVIQSTSSVYIAWIKARAAEEERLWGML